MKCEVEIRKAYVKCSTYVFEVVPAASFIRPRITVVRQEVQRYHQGSLVNSDTQYCHQEMSFLGSAVLRLFPHAGSVAAAVPNVSYSCSI